METLVMRVQAEQLELRELLAKHSFELLELHDLDNCGVNEYSVRNFLSYVDSLSNAFGNYTTVIGKHKNGGLYYLLVSDNNIFMLVNSKGKFSIRPLWEYYNSKKLCTIKQPNLIGKFTDKKINDWLEYSKEVINHHNKSKIEETNHAEKIKADTEIILNRLKRFIKYDHSENNKIYYFGEMFAVNFKRDNTVSEAKYQFKIDMYYNSNINEFLDLLGK
jgi:hypothetical protein